MNNNQYSSLPHTQNTGGVGTQQQRNAYANNNNGNGNPQPNRPYNNKKKHYNKHKNNTYNKPNQPFNTYNTNNNVNHTDFGCTSLPHTQTHNNYSNNRYSVPFHQFNKFSNENASPDLESFGNNVPVPKLNKNNNKNRKARGGSNNNYRTNAVNDNRLNKSLSKDGSLDNSLSEIVTSGMPTSLSLDNIGSFNNHSSPAKININDLFNKLTKPDTILEQEVSTTTGNYADSGVDSSSYSSMPISDNVSSCYYQKSTGYTPDAQMLSSIECDNEEEAEEKEKTSTTSSSISSSSSPDSPNTNGYQTAISQMTSEAEMSFGYDSLNTVNVENTITNFNIEAEFFGEIESFMSVKKSEIAYTIEEEEKNVEKLAEEAGHVESNTVDEDTTTSIVSDSSDTGSIKEAELAEEETDEVKEELVGKAEETTHRESSVLTSPVPEIVVSMAVSDEETEVENPEAVCEETKAKMPNLMSKENVLKELESFDKSDIAARHAESELNSLINTIVGDVITSAMHAEAAVPEQVVQPFETNYMSLEQEISQLEEKEKEKEKEIEKKEKFEEEEGEISFIDNDNSILYSKGDTSAVVIDDAEEANVESTRDILSRTEKVLSGSSSSLKVTDSKGKMVVKEPPVDCFSCTIS